MEPTVEGRRSEEEGTDRVAFDLVDALDGLFVVNKRSRTLDGAIPVRAAQGCPPFLEGNSAGFQLRLAEPAVIRVTDGVAEIHASDRIAAKIAGYDESLERLVSTGLLMRDGYWHRRLIDTPMWHEEDHVYIWTGLLIRVAPGLRVLLTGAFNRRVRATVEDCVIADEHAFVPVVLNLVASSFTNGRLWLDTDLACLLPIQETGAFDVRPIEDRPDVGDAVIRFYSSAYLDKRKAGGISGDYRRMVAHEMTDQWDSVRRPELVFAGPDVHAIESFHRFATAAGVTDIAPTGCDVRFVVVRNLARLSGCFDGIAVRDLAFEGAAIMAEARAQWIALFGEAGARLFDGLTVYANSLDPPRIEPQLLIHTLAFVRTPPGWSSVLDSLHIQAAEGLRGVQSTDTFYGLGTLLQFVQSMPFTIEAGAPLLRVLPVPRAALRATYRALVAADAAGT